MPSGPCTHEHPAVIDGTWHPNDTGGCWIDALQGDGAGPTIYVENAILWCRVCGGLRVDGIWNVPQREGVGR